LSISLKLKSSRSSDKSPSLNPSPGRDCKQGALEGYGSSRLGKTSSPGRDYSRSKLEFVAWVTTRAELGRAFCYFSSGEGCSFGRKQQNSFLLTHVQPKNQTRTTSNIFSHYHKQYSCIRNTKHNQYQPNIFKKCKNISFLYVSISTL